MKKLYLKIVLFIIPVFILLALLPINRRLKYQGLKGGCSNRGMWLHDRVFLNPLPVDLAFIGTSRTSNGISDKIIQKDFEKDSINVKVANLGYCRDGRNITYSFLKDIIKGKEIKYLFLEVREDESRKGHTIFPYVAETKDVLAPVLFYNPNYFSDIWEHYTYKLEIFQDDVYKRVEPHKLLGSRFRALFFKDTVAANHLDRVQKKRQEDFREMPKWERNFHMNYSRGYLQKIYKLCEANNIILKFVYIPGYGIPHELPLEFETYKQYGEVYLPPKQIFENKNNWVDHEHLNQSGAYELSYWLASEIKQREFSNK